MAARRSPHFFKVFFPRIAYPNLAIPHAFLKHIEGESGRTFSLTGPSGNKWNVDLVERDGEMVFNKGWKEFVAENFIDVGDFLLFRYDGSLCFTVIIFDPSACEKEQPLYAKPNRDTTDCGLKECERNPVTVRVNRENKATLKRKRGAPDLLDEHRKKPSIPAVDLKKPQNNPCAQKTVKAEVIVDEQAIGLSSGSSDIHKVEEPRLNHKPQSNHPHAERTDKRSEVTVDESPAGWSGASGGDTENAMGESPTSSSTSESDVREMKGKMQIITTSKQRQTNHESYSAPLKSQRRPVSQRELNRAIEMSEKFTSTHPYVPLVMQDSYCYHHFQLNLPFRFAKVHLPMVSTRMTLWDPDGRSWQVAYLFYRRRAGIRSGWNKFSFANNLETGDVCIFEIIKSDEMRVHIYRVVEPVTPLVRFNPR